MDKLTFWDLLTKYEGIEIPMIQRSYAQGRKTAFTNNIRKNLLDAIQNAFNNGMVMDFVYGTINDSSKFEPLDGQQRLTTLFLLHWYFASRERREEIKKTLEKFSYKTRISSERFCKELAKFFWNQEEGEKLKQGKLLSKIIENQSWFAPAWKHDPTVLAMLTMLDDIHAKFKNTGNLNKLIEDRIIVFNFVDLKDFSLTDDLYIKMNARGKPLTPFEIFKSALDKKMKEYQNVNLMPKDEVKEYSHLLDGNWLQLFFDVYEDNFDACFLAFFVRVLEYTILESSPAAYDELFKQREAMLPKKGEHKNFGGKFPFEFYDKHINEKTMINALRAAKNFLNNLEKRIDNLIDEKYKPTNELFDERDVCRTVLTEPDHKYIESLKFYAYYKYLSQEKMSNIEKFEKWMRVACNIAEAARLDDNYVAEITRLKKLYENADNIEEYLAKEDVFNGPHNEAWQEEQLKARILCQTSSEEEWRELIYRAEQKKRYLNGTIGFLLRFAGIAPSSGIEPNALDAEKKVKFKEYIIKAEAIFGEKGNLRNKTEHLFRRALLSCGDYTVQEKRNKIDSNYSLLELTSRNNRRKQFDEFLTGKEKGENDIFKENSLKILFDKCECSDCALSQSSLESLIERNLPQIDDWRVGFVKHSEILEHHCKRNYLFRKKSWAGGMLVLAKMKLQAEYWGYYPLWLYYDIKGIKRSYEAAPEVHIEEINALKGDCKIEECVIAFKKSTENIKVYIMGNKPNEPQQWKWIIEGSNSESVEIPQKEGGMINEKLYEYLVDKGWITVVPKNF